MEDLGLLINPSLIEEELEETYDDAGNNRDGSTSQNFDIEEALLGLIEMFPDISIEFARQLLDQNSNDFRGVVELIMDANGGYPKDCISDFTTHTSRSQRHEENETEEMEPSPPAYDFTSKNSFTPSFQYKMQSLNKLVYDFPFLNYRKAKAILKESSYHYYIAFSAVCNAVLSKVDTVVDHQDGRKLDEILLCVLCDKKAPKAVERALLADIVEVKISRKRFFSLPLRRHREYPRITCPILTQEVVYVNEKVEEMKATLETKIAKRRRKDAASRNGITVSCSCCYDDFPIEDMVACRNEGHLFCEECLSCYVKSQIFGNGSLGVVRDDEVATEIICCAGDCSSGFSAWALRKALKDVKVLRAYDEMQYRVIIEKAGLSQNMYSCPKCQLIFEVAEEIKFLVCGNCNFEACKECREPPHAGKRCDEVEKAVEARGRHRVEEAATAALVRKCPRCQRGVLKDGGCNKISCACGKKFCYCCLKEIKNYRHFCQKPHCTHPSPQDCNFKCPLYGDDLEVQDREKVREAALTEAARLEEVKVDIESILAEPSRRYYDA